MEYLVEKVGTGQILLQIFLFSPSVFHFNNSPRTFHHLHTTIYELTYWKRR